MQITLTETEFNQAIECWLREQGFETEQYNIGVKIIPGRKYDTTVVVTLDNTKDDVFNPKVFGGIPRSPVITTADMHTISKPVTDCVDPDSMAIQAAAGISINGLSFNNPEETL